jgi:hypothetical protein
VLRLAEPLCIQSYAGRAAGNCFADEIVRGVTDQQENRRHHGASGARLLGEAFGPLRA